MLSAEWDAWPSRFHNLGILNFIGDIRCNPKNCTQKAFLVDSQQPRFHTSEEESSKSLTV